MLLRIRANRPASCSRTHGPCRSTAVFQTRRSKNDRRGATSLRCIPADDGAVRTTPRPDGVGDYPTVSTVLAQTSVGPIRRRLRYTLDRAGSLGGPSWPERLEGAAARRERLTRPAITLQRGQEKRIQALLERVVAHSAGRVAPKPFRPHPRTAASADSAIRFGCTTRVKRPHVVGLPASTAIVPS